LGVVFGFCGRSSEYSDLPTPVLYSQQKQAAGRYADAAVVIEDQRPQRGCYKSIAAVYNSSPTKKTDSWHWQTTLKHAFPSPILPRLLCVYSLTATATDSADALNLVRNGPRAAC